MSFLRRFAANQHIYGESMKSANRYKRPAGPKIGQKSGPKPKTATPKPSQKKLGRTDRAERANKFAPRPLLFREAFDELWAAFFSSPKMKDGVWKRAS